MFIMTIVQLWIFASYHRIFCPKLCDRGTWNLVCIEYPYGLIYKKNFKFLGGTVSEKNAMLTCKISKLFIRTIVQLWIFASYHRIFCPKLCDRGTWNLVCIEYPYGLIYKKNFKFLGLIVSEKNTTLTCKISSCLLGQMCNFECLEDIIAFFSKTVRPRNMKFGLHRVSIWVNRQKKFQVPRSHNIGEKWDDNFKVSSHFSLKLCDRWTWNLVYIEYSYGLIYKKNFKFLGRTVSEKSAMIISSYHRIFLQSCATEEHEIWFA